MTCYVIAVLRTVSMGEDIRAYLSAIDDTLRPFDGRFLIHGGQKYLLEETFPGDLIMLGFPDMNQARGWYDSAPYRAILPLRLKNATGPVFMIEGVDANHRALDILSA